MSRPFPTLLQKKAHCCSEIVRENPLFHMKNQVQIFCKAHDTFDRRTRTNHIFLGRCLENNPFQLFPCTFVDSFYKPTTAKATQAILKSAIQALRENITLPHPLAMHLVPLVSALITLVTLKTAKPIALPPPASALTPNKPPSNPS